MLRLDDIQDLNIAVDATADVIMTREMSPIIQAMIKEVGAWQLAGVGVETAFNMLDARVVGYLQDFAGYRIKMIAETTRKQIVVALAQGVAEGEGTQALARRVRKVFSNASKSRAYAIAKTEVTSAASFARDTAFQQAGTLIVHGKRWLSTRDNRTRDPHRDLNGQTIPMNGFFDWKGHKATRPGAFAKAFLNVNCRCTILPVVPKVDRADALSEDEMISQFDRMRDEWDLKMVNATKRAFVKLEKEVFRVANLEG